MHTLWIGFGLLCLVLLSHFCHSFLLTHSSRHCLFAIQRTGYSNAHTIDLFVPPISLSLRKRESNNIENKKIKSKVYIFEVWLTYRINSILFLIFSVLNIVNFGFFVHHQTINAWKISFLTSFLICFFVISCCLQKIYISKNYS